LIGGTADKGNGEMGHVTLNGLKRCGGKGKQKVGGVSGDFEGNCQESEGSGRVPYLFKNQLDED